MQRDKHMGLPGKTDIKWGVIEVFGGLGGLAQALSLLGLSRHL